MKIYAASGFECEKELRASPEDLFNISEVTYDYNGQLRHLDVTYLRYFEHYLQEQAIYDPKEHGVPFYHICALLILMANDGYIADKRLYYNDTDEFIQAFSQTSIAQALSIYKAVTDRAPK